MKTKFVLPLLLIVGGLLVGCATSNQLDSLQVGMTKDQVVALLGKPDSTGAQANIEYLTYYLNVATSDGPGRDQPYFVRLVDGKVESFGRFAQMYDLASRPVAGMPPVGSYPPGSGPYGVATASVAPAAPDLAAQIAKLKELKDQGVLTDDEFQKAKAKLLASP
jgi:hypothetical protein